MGALDYNIYPLSNLTRWTCFDIRRFPCCGDQVGSVDKLRLDLFREGRECEDDLLLSYDFFHIDEDTGSVCVIWDDELTELCQGRYIGYVYFDCRLIDKIRFILGMKPVIREVDSVVSKIPNCFSNEPAPVMCDGTNMCDGEEGKGLVEPDQCCEDISECDIDPCCDCVDPCDPCNCLDDNGDED